MKRDQNFKNNKPILYVIATPIGNLDEFTERAKKIVIEMDFIACEDTRVTGKLLSFFDLKKKLISCHEHNEVETAQKIINLIKGGNKIAYMSDAGYPSISDPGQKLIALALDNDINVSVISGPNASINALVGSGLPSDHFYFYGFLDAKENAKKEELKELASRKETIIFYESPHRIIATLKSMQEILGNRRIVIARELTKIHEEYLRGTIDEMVEYGEDNLIGEMVLVVEGNTKTESDNVSEEGAIKMIDELVKKGLSNKDAIKQVSEKTKLNKNQLYKIYHEAK